MLLVRHEGSARKATGTRRNATSAGSCLAQASSAGSKA